MSQFSDLTEFVTAEVPTSATPFDHVDLSSESLNFSAAEGLETTAAFLPAVGKAIGMKVAKVVAKEVIPEQMHRVEAVKHGGKAVLGVAATGAALFIFGTGLAATAAIAYTGYQAFKAHSEWKKGSS